MIRRDVTTAFANVEGIEALSIRIKSARRLRIVIRNTMQMQKHVFPQSIKVVLTTLHGIAKYKSGCPPRELATWARGRMIELGPSFVKLGQMVASRPDVFPTEVISEFQPLLSSVPVVPFEDLNITSLSPRVTLDKAPLATGSIAQVHLGTLVLRSQPTLVKKKVVVKIKKPDVSENLQRDIDSLRSIVKACVSVVSGLNDLDAFLDQFQLMVTNEVDFVREADNMVAYQGFRNPLILVPQVYERECTPDCIVMDYCPSRSVSDFSASTSKLQRSLSANMLMQTYMHRLLSSGHFHADPHPGNIGMLDDGRIVFYDYGAVMKFDSYMQSALRHICACIITGDVDGMVDEMVKRRIITTTNGTAEFSKSDMVKIHSYVRAMVRYVQNTDIQEVGAVVSAVAGSDSRSPFAFAPKVLLMLRAMAMLEGTCKALDPDFSYTASLAGLFFTDAGVRILENRVMTDVKLLSRLMNLQ
jgi:predicted unusual protein kinase regulating ubiquinone biosynthesis (AarF/ABC1/UbiB family)